MSDIFLSYDGKDLDRIKILVTALESKGWTVFYDRTIPPGKTWRQFISREIEQCHCMVVVWSVHSVNSAWVEVEADIGLKRKILIPLLLDQVTPPLGFGTIQAANLVNWKGKQNAPGFIALCRAVAELIGSDDPPILRGDEPVKTSGTQLSGLFSRLSSKHFLTIGAIGLLAIIGVVSPKFLDALASYGKDIKNPSQTVTKTVEPALLTTDQNNGPKFLINEPAMVRIPAGEFWMGSDDGEKKPHYNENPRHKAHIATFFLGKYEITKAQFRTFTEHTGYEALGCFLWKRPMWLSEENWQLDTNKNWEQPGFSQTDNDPVACISYKDAKEYILWLNNETKGNYRLPTEAEWEYSARANTGSDYYWGQAKPEFYAWYSDNSRVKTQPVGLKRPNAFDLYDMVGNVKEWTEDCWHNYVAALTDGSTYRKKNNGNCTIQVLRGGSWSDGLDDLRSASRYGATPTDRYGNIGFRLAKD